MLDNKSNKKLEEAQVIHHLLESRDYKGFYDLRPFFNLLYDPISNEEFSKYKGFFVATNILRTELGFDKSSKPGDFDVIIIPYSMIDIYFERTAVFEVKVVRPTRANPSRNANSLGLTQVQGLVKDGFPLVSLLHVCMTEPLIEEEMTTVDFIPEAINIDGDKDWERKYADRIQIKADFFSSKAADNQIRRIISTDLPKFVGISALGLNFYKDGRSAVSSCSQDFSNFQSGYFNPFTKQETIEKVKQHFFTFKNKYQSKLIK